MRGVSQAFTTTFHLLIQEKRQTHLSDLFCCHIHLFVFTLKKSRSSMAALPAWNLLKGKTAAITGGTTGIGRAIVLAYITQGCNVAVNHLGMSQDDNHRRSLLEEVKTIKNKGINAGEIMELSGDVTNPETGSSLVKEAVSRWGKLDIFVANAGVFKQAEFLK